jgi:hypothetical protein
MSDMVMKIIATVCTLLALSLIILAETKYQTWSDLISDLTKENDLVLPSDEDQNWPWDWSYDNVPKFTASEQVELDVAIGRIDSALSLNMKGELGIHETLERIRNARNSKIYKKYVKFKFED